MVNISTILWKLVRGLAINCLYKNVTAVELVSECWTSSWFCTDIIPRLLAESNAMLTAEYFRLFMYT